MNPKNVGSLVQVKDERKAPLSLDSNFWILESTVRQTWQGRKLTFVGTHKEHCISIIYTQVTCFPIPK